MLFSPFYKALENTYSEKETRPLSHSTLKLLEVQLSSTGVKSLSWPRMGRGKQEETFIHAS